MLMELIRFGQMLCRLYCTCALLLFLAAPADAQQAAVPAAGATGYTVFFRGTPLGREEVTITTDATGTTIASQNRLGAPLNMTLRRIEFKDAPDWTAVSFVAEGTVNNDVLRLRTMFAGETATTDGIQGTTPVKVSHTVAPQVVVLPNAIFALYAALGRRLQNAAPGAEFKAYILPVTEISMRVAAVRAERMQVGASIFNVRRYELTFANLDGPVTVNLTTTEDGGLVRVSAPASGLDIVREDVAASTSRTEVFSNPNEESVTIPIVGFNLAATITRPKGSTAAAPAIVLVSSSAAGDRDGFGLGVPFLGQLAGALADGGFLVLRFDRRGFGQSGGRSESATLADYAEDVRSIVRWLGERKDVDRNRIAVAGHGDGGWVALLAAASERRRIAAVITIAAPGSTGSEFLLEQQQTALDQLKLPAADREQRIALQKQIHSAVITGKGWENVPAAMRREADTRWMHSLLAFDPAKTMANVRQPLMIVHGELDRQVPVAHADAARHARPRKDGRTGGGGGHRSRRQPRAGASARPAAHDTAAAGSGGERRSSPLRSPAG